MSVLSTLGTLARSLYAPQTLFIDLAIGAYLVFDGLYSMHTARKHKEKRGSKLSRYVRTGIGIGYSAMALGGMLAGIGASVTRKLVGAYMFFDGLLSLYWGSKEELYKRKDVTALRLARAAVGGYTLATL